MEEEKVNTFELFSTSEDDTKFIINFDKIFEKEKLQVYNQFDLSAKRNFKMILGMIKETYETIFLKDGQLKPQLQITLLQILNVQSKIMKNQSMTANTLIDLLHVIINSGNSALLNEISDYVERGYGLTLDADTEKMRKKNKAAINDQLIISDEYGKILIKIAYLERIMIPLISQFFIYNKAEFPTKATIVQDDSDENSEDLIFSEINQKIFNDLFTCVAKENTMNIQNKLYKLVYSRIIKTAFSSSRFWSVAKTVGISKESSSFEIYSKILCNSIPKLLLNKDLNVVNFFSTIINNQILFLFSNKFKTHYQALGPNYNTGSLFESNEENMTDLEKMEIQLGHTNEGGLILNNIIASEVINKIDTFLDVAVTKEEIANSLKYIHMNPIQERIVALISFKYFKSTDAIKRLSAFEYAKLLLCCVKYLEKQKFLLLPKLMLSKCVKQRDRVAITGTKVKMKIEESKRYSELLEIKYKDFKNDIERNIQAMISTIYSSTFFDEKGDDVFDTSIKIGNIAEEIVDLCFLI